MTVLPGAMAMHHRFDIFSNVERVSYRSHNGAHVMERQIAETKALSDFLVWTVKDCFCGR